MEDANSEQNSTRKFTEQVLDFEAGSSVYDPYSYPSNYYVALAHQQVLVIATTESKIK
jgi:hypothetical protein